MPGISVAICIVQHSVRNLPHSRSGWKEIRGQSTGSVLPFGDKRATSELKVTIPHYLGCCQAMGSI